MAGSSALYRVGQVDNAETRLSLSRQDYQPKRWPHWHAVDAEPYAVGRSVCGLDVVVTYAPFVGLLEMGTRGGPPLCRRCVRIMCWHKASNEGAQPSPSWTEFADWRSQLEDLEELLAYWAYYEPDHP